MKTLLLTFGFVAIVSCALAVECPDEDEHSEATYYPHEVECGKFYECHNGVATVLDCPTGTYWNTRINVCDRDVDCGDLLTSTAPPPPTSTTTESTTVTEDDGGDDDDDGYF